ncbi:acyl carrier protein phosphodiesterase [Verrucomicrobiota bacterium sgz303538]
MNWLAHLLLSEGTAECRLGSLLPDFLRSNELRLLPGEFRGGIERHWVIDAFTDRHPIVLRSRSRLAAPYRRYGGIIIDMYYDHLLASNWECYSRVALADFTADVYTSIGKLISVLPPEVNERLARMMREDWLGSYRDADNIRLALQRIGMRFRQPVDLSGAVATLEQARAGFEEDFEQFFPELREHLRIVCPS